jgi:hypothetical protein
MNDSPPTSPPSSVELLVLSAVEVILANRPTVHLIQSIGLLSSHCHQYFTERHPAWCRRLIFLKHPRSQSPPSTLLVSQWLLLTKGVETGNLATIFRLNQPWILAFGASLVKYLIGARGLAEMYYQNVLGVIAIADADQVLKALIEVTPRMLCLSADDTFGIGSKMEQRWTALAQMLGKHWSKRCFVVIQELCQGINDLARRRVLHQVFRYSGHRLSLTEVPAPKEFYTELDQCLSNVKRDWKTRHDLDDNFSFDAEDHNTDDAKDRCRLWSQRFVELNQTIIQFANEAKALYYQFDSQRYQPRAHG